MEGGNVGKGAMVIGKGEKEVECGIGGKNGQNGGGTEPSPGEQSACLGRLTSSNSGSEKGRENGKGEVPTPAESR